MTEDKYLKRSIQENTRAETGFKKATFFSNRQLLRMSCNHTSPCYFHIYSSVCRSCSQLHVSVNRKYISAGSNDAHPGYWPAATKCWQLKTGAQWLEKSSEASEYIYAQVLLTVARLSAEWWSSELCSPDANIGSYSLDKEEDRRDSEDKGLMRSSQQLHWFSLIKYNIIKNQGWTSSLFRTDCNLKIIWAAQWQTSRNRLLLFWIVQEGELVQAGVR